MCRAVEEPCEVTGRPCEWACEDEYDADGELINFDLYCVNCFRWRDWEKDELEEE